MQREVTGALRGMGAVAAGLIAATGLKLFGALQNNVLGLRLCLVLGLLGFAAVALLHWPLLYHGHRAHPRRLAPVAIDRRQRAAGPGWV